MAPPLPPEPAFDDVVLALHGGAGVISRSEMSPGLEAEYRDALAAALSAGLVALRTGGAVEAVEAAVNVLEDSPLFNAGRGSVFTHEGTIEMDASIMDGATMAAGAVAQVTRARNPVTVARAVLERTPHVLLCGPGADAFVRDLCLAEEPPEYFRTERRRKQLLDDLAAERYGTGGAAGSEPAAPPASRFGTVGAVARVAATGSLAAATSTGGRSNKRWGRVGDSPVIGGGCFAKNGVVAVSATGDGEIFQRVVAAHEVAALVEHARLDVAAAAARVIHGSVAALGGEGGLVALAPDGRLAMPFNSEGMYRAHADAKGRLTVSIWRDDATVAG